MSYPLLITLAGPPSRGRAAPYDPLLYVSLEDTRFPTWFQSMQPAPFAAALHPDGLAERRAHHVARGTGACALQLHHVILLEPEGHHLGEVPSPMTPSRGGALPLNPWRYI